MDDIPAEILATAFEMGVLDWGVHFLPPICLVCRTWNEIVSTTPHLWGIVDVSPKSHSPRPWLLLDQIARAKHAPLTVFIDKGANKRNRLDPVLAQLIQLSRNWISAVLPCDVLERCRWHDLKGKLQSLTVTQGCPGKDSPFFRTDGDVDSIDLRLPPALTRLSIVGSNPPRQFLSRSLKTFTLVPGRTNHIALSETLDHLSSIPNIEILSISQLKHYPRLPDTPRIIHLNNLTSLKLSTVDYPSLLLSSLACPSLEVLSLGPCPVYSRWGSRPESAMRPLTPFLSQWCNPEYTPRRLHTLRIEQSLAMDDTPCLIRFLARLPNIAHLAICDDAVAEYLKYNTKTNEDGDILKALASSTGGRRNADGADEWLCPRLGYLEIELDAPFHRLLDIAQARGIHSTSPGGLRTLRRVAGYLCREGTDEEMELFRSLVQDLECECLACGAGFLTSKFVQPILDLG